MKHGIDSPAALQSGEDKYRVEVRLAAAFQTMDLLRMKHLLGLKTKQRKQLTQMPSNACGQIRLLPDAHAAVDIKRLTVNVISFVT